MGALKVLDDSGDMVFIAVVYLYCFSYGIFSAEKTLCHALSQNQGKWVLKRCLGISRNRRKGKNIEYRGVRPGKISYGNHFLARWIIILPVLHKIVMPQLETHDFFGLDDVFRYPFPHSWGHSELVSVIALDAINSIRICVISVYAQLVLDEKENHHENANAKCQASKIYE